MKCPSCGNTSLTLQPHKKPYYSPTGNLIHEALLEVYICEKCGKEMSCLPNMDEDSLGAGLFEED